jgi:hypothetical protein
MSDIPHRFHTFALTSILFKGRSDWYFCYLKAEKIAHVLSFIAEDLPLTKDSPLYELIAKAAEVPDTIVHFAAGEVEIASVLADIFSLLSALRLCASSGMLGTENAALLVKEYEQVAEKIGGGHLSPFVSNEDFTVPMIELENERHLGPATNVPENYKGQSKGHVAGALRPKVKEAEGRFTKILDLVRSSNGISIKDISKVVKNCSEKTIQRELADMIRQKLVKKEGERRWSIYVPVLPI